MSLMSPVLRVRQVVRRMGASSADADEFADAMSEFPAQRELKLMIDEAFSRWFNRILLAMIVVAGIAIAIVEAVN